VIGFEREDDARRVYEVLPKRFQKYGLTISPEKTNLWRYGRPSRNEDGNNDTFNFLGFTHYWAKSRQGYWIIKRKTERKRLRRTLKAIWAWCKIRRHENEAVQYHSLCRKLTGHYNYFAVRCNYKSLNLVHQQTCKYWKYWLSRRSNESGLSWKEWEKFSLRFPLPKPCIKVAI
jgi:hypothetical protein